MSWFCIGISDKSGGRVGNPNQKTMNVSSTNRLNLSLLLFLLHTIHLMLIWWIFYRIHENYFVKESSASYVISLQKSHSRRSYKQALVYTNM